MMITSFWYVFYRTPTKLCKVLLGCCVGFYTLVVCFGLFSRSLEAVDCSADPWKFGPRSKFFGYFISLQFLLFGIPGQVEFVPYVRVQPISLAPTFGEQMWLVEELPQRMVCQVFVML